MLQIDEHKHNSRASRVIAVVTSAGFSMMRGKNEKATPFFVGPLGAHERLYTSKSLLQFRSKTCGDSVTA